jgi:hypothetical protein
MTREGVQLGFGGLLKQWLIPRMLKNAQVQGSRNPESGVATNKERLLATPAS